MNNTHITGMFVKCIHHVLENVRQLYCVITKILRLQITIIL